MRSFKVFITYFLLTVISFFFIFPVIWIFVTSLKNSVDASHFFQFTNGIHFENYVEAWNSAGFKTSFLNTIIIAVGTVVISLLIGFPAAYALVRSPIGKKFKSFFNVSINSMRVIPEMVFLIPLFVLYQRTKLYDTLPGMIFAFQILTLPYCILLLCNFIRGIPEELEEAARIDGCPEKRILTKVMVPLVMPGIVTSGILAFISVWTGLMFPLALSYSKAQTVAVSISTFKGYGAFNWPVMAAASLMVTIPQIILFAFCNKYLITGYTMGAVKE